MKFIGSIFIVIGCSLVGLKLSLNLSNRRKDLIQLNKAVHILESEIMYVYTEIPEIFLKIGLESNDYIGNIFKSAGEGLTNGKYDDITFALKSSVEEYEDITYLEKKDLNIIFDLGSVLGQWDLEAHRKGFLITKKNIQENLDEAKSKEIKLSKMYKVLGVSFGLTICILLF